MVVETVEEVTMPGVVPLVLLLPLGGVDLVWQDYEEMYHQHLNDQSICA